MTGLKRLNERLTALIFPNRCAFCGRVMGGGSGVCPECEKALPRITRPICKNCGRETEYCTCRKRHFEFNRCIAPFYYQGVAKKGILRLKFGRKQSVAAVFADFAADMAHREYAGIAFDFVTAVPLSRKELRKRGFNQSAEFAKALAGNLGIPYLEVLSKPVDTKAQRSCQGNERWGNVFGVFKAGEAAGGKTVLLVDDIVTTGATLNECAKMLRFGGALDVYSEVIACVKKR
jgi:competence protein ComFC